MSYDVIIKSTAPQWIASVREVIPAYNTVGSLYPKVMAGLGPAMATCQMGVAIWHDPEYRESNVDAEAGFFFKEAPRVANGVGVHQLPAATVASTVHHGAYRDLQSAYDALLRWVAGSGYQVTGPIRELYLHCTEPVTQDNESYVTEIQVPVAKA